MEGKGHVLFRDFSQAESQHIREISSQHRLYDQRDRSTRHFTDALMAQDDKGDENFQLMVSEMDNKMFEDNLNESNNTDPNEPGTSTGNKVDKFHSIPSLVQSREVIPETPKEQRVPRQAKLTTYIKPRATSSEGHVGDVSIERSDSATNEQISREGQQMANELMNTSDSTESEPNELLLHPRNTSTPFRRFEDWNVQTSLHRHDVMTSIAGINRTNPVSHMNNMVRDIRANVIFVSGN